MYGVPKVHKPNAPLRPILSMVNSPQHATAKWLSTLLKLVSERFSAFTIKDNFTFADAVKKVSLPKGAHMSSFDIKSLFTNVPLGETVDICLKELYHSDLEKPTLSEKSFRKLIYKVTTGVEFSFDDTMYRQVDGVAMGSPLGPVLANIFVGHCEKKLNLEEHPDLLMYHRYVDDTFSITTTVESSSNLLCCLNELHQSLEFTSEDEKDGRLPFMDVMVLKTTVNPTARTTTSASAQRCTGSRHSLDTIWSGNPSLLGDIRSTSWDASLKEQSEYVHTTNFKRNWP